MPRLTKNEKKALWAILWRVILLGPFFGVIGLALLILVLAAFIAPPCLAAIALLSGDWLYAVLYLAAWAVVLRFRHPILRWTFQGYEYTGL